MSIENPIESGNTHIETHELRERMFFPHGDEIAKAFEKRFGKEVGPVETETIKEILNTYIEQKIRNTELYKSEELGASFVYSVTDIADLAKTLYTNFTKQDVSNLKKPEDSQEKDEKEFLFIGGIYNTEAGNEYVSQEKIFHDIFTALPGAIDDIRLGNEPKNKRIYTLGSPTNELGEISESFLNNNVFSEFASLYSEFIKTKIENDDTEIKQNFNFNGISIGAGIAVETAKKMLEEKVITQSNEEASEKNIPLLRLRIDTPPGQSDAFPKVRKWQIPVGFVLELGRLAVTDPYLRNIMVDDKKFMDSKNSVLEEKGIIKHMSQEQEDLKKRTISIILKSLSDGVEIPKDLKLTEVIGTKDPLMYTPSFNKRVAEHQKTLSKRREENNESNTKSIGDNIVRKEEFPNRRTFSVSMGHNIPFLHDSEFNRLKRAVKSLTDLME